MALTEKQAAFVREYLVDLNATQAAIRTGYSEKTARGQGSRLLTNADIAAAVKAAQDRLADKFEVTRERIVAEFAKLGFSDIRRIFTADGQLQSPTEMDDHTAAAIQSVEVITRRTPGDEKHVEQIHKIKMADKSGALTQLGRHLGMFVDKSEVDLRGQLNVTIAPADADL